MSATAVRPVAAPPAAPPLRWSPAELLPPLVVAVLGTVLLLPGHGLWFDELFTAEVGRLPVREILAAVVEGRGTTSYLADVPPSYNAPYYLVVCAWTSLPGLGGDTSLRVLSLLATAGGLALVTRAVTRLAGPATGVLAGTVLATAPLLLEQAVEARSYGLVVLATGAALLGLVRRLQEPPRGLLLFGLAGAAMGLMHWYAVTVLAGFVVAALLLRGRRALPVLLTGAAAAVPTAALVAVNLLNGTGGRNAEHLRDTGGTLADRAVEAWAGGRTPLLYLTVGLAVLGALRAAGLRVVAACWLLVPLLLLLGAELVRPVYLPRYLLAGLLALGVLAAAGALAVPRAARAPVAALLVALSLLAAAPLAAREPRERADEVVAFLAERHRPGEPVVAADQRSATGVDHYVRTAAPQLRPDVVLPPDDAPAGADRVWLVRRLIDGAPVPTDDDAILAGAGLRVTAERSFPAVKTDLVVQLWER
ncbi:ArnT family glycosyltransferase [Geodermatophilus ruber]|uniref:Dolichyl-phosphate-mannose-protein mannosyltransferase n=1 Tax=Geodermatophilus ruber TaxID=504800 RepID=A0A1I4EYG1_9ACTN|nr:glycosyltransferase family 39 protein [Geodermatophilus ruber]SFL10758.1 Dolichyl-phosphate-mannose-protein mannosyltransferase [Geodermatophilus ruber]